MFSGTLPCSATCRLKLASSYIGDKLLIDLKAPLFFYELLNFEESGIVRDTLQGELWLNLNFFVWLV